ncbi:uncharacterized protein LOC110850052 isoform X2 [Folsomia candida]|uniref:uncharacterized protein LOC110850052 isoform X2 n=1 Tax=Folsomia candida TaxID=158441 RepID=UPI001604EC08|nr:uncharacterized protein LOC110850052 isoform X2 [Folsomia candida]
MNLAMENCKSDAKNLLMNENFFKMHRLINDKASEKFRMRFLDLWNASGNPEWENIPHFGRTFIEDIGSSLYYKSKKIQKQLLESGQINTWDLPLLFASIQSINTYTNTKSSRTDFDELLRIRNKLSHLGSTELGDDEFAKLWSAATNILLKYGLSQGEIDDVLTMKLGTTTEFEDKLNQNLDKIKMLREEGNALFKNGEFKRSIERYSEAMLVENISTTELGILYSNRSAAHLGVKNYSDAKIDARCSVNLRPNWGRGYYRLGCTYDKLEQYDKALYYYNLSLKYDPSNSRCLDCQQGAIHMIAKRNRQEHLDPLTMPVTDADMLAFRERVTGPEMIAVGELLSDKIKKERYLAGDPHYTCTEAHNYLCGLKGYTQNYERAAQLFAKAAKEGSAEGMYNLAKLTSEGKGVQRNMVESFQLFLRAADRPRLMEILPGTGVKTRRIGVMEAQHALGLHFETDGILGRDYHQAYNWYTKALLNGSGPSANNLGLMFSEGKGFTPDLEKAVGYWQISALYGITRAMESLAFHNFYNGRPTRAFKWYTLAVKNKTMNSNLHMIFEKEPPLEQFVAEEFEQTIEEELMAGPMRKYVDLKDYHENIDGMERRRERRRKMLELVQPNAAGGKVQTIVNHRIALNQIKKEKSSESDWTTKQAKLFPTRTPNLLGLKPITLKELDKSIHDKTYDGFAIRLTVIEDAILGLPSVQILAEDENGDIEKVYIYNYQQGPTTQDELGYACAFTVINPYFRLMADRKWGIRVDDPNLLIKHPLMKGQDRCRPVR